MPPIARRTLLARLTALTVVGAHAAWAQGDGPPPSLSFDAGSEQLEFRREDIWTVSAHPGLQQGAVNLTVHLTSGAKDRFARFTAVHVGQPIAVFLGGKQIMEAVVQAPITGGRFAIPFANQPSAAAAMDLILRPN